MQEFWTDDGPRRPVHWPPPTVTMANNRTATAAIIQRTVLKATKTSTLAQPGTQSRNEFRGRLCFCHSISYELLGPRAPMKNPVALRTRVQVLQHVLARLDEQFAVQICVEIASISLAGAFIEVNYVHKHLPPVKPVHNILYSREYLAGLGRGVSMTTKIAAFISWFTPQSKY
jgi:hypothetical protein